MGVGGAEGNELRRALGQVDHGHREVTTHGGEPRLAAPGQQPREPRHDGGRQHEGHGQDHRGGRQHPPQQDDGRDAHDQRDAEGGNHPEDQVLHGIDVVDHAGQEVTTPERGQARGRQPLEPLVDLHPQVGEEPEGGVVADQALLVAQEPTGQPEELHGHDGHRQGGLVRVLCRLRDQPGGRAQETDVRRDGARAEERRDDHAARRRTGHGRESGPPGRARPTCPHPPRRGSRRHRLLNGRSSVGPPGRSPPGGTAGGPP